MIVYDNLFMREEMKYFIIVLVSLITGLLIGNKMTKAAQEVDHKVHIPGEPKVQRGILEVLGVVRVRRHSNSSYEKSNLKQLGTTVAMYYTDGGESKYPENPKDFDFDESLFRPRHLSGKYIELPEDWQIPEDWKSYNQSNTPYVFLRSSDSYTGDASVPMFITRYGYQAGEAFYQAVFEDGHVEKIPFDDAVVLWKKAGVWVGE